jgi:hypothetical protein
VDILEELLVSGQLLLPTVAYGQYRNQLGEGNKHNVAVLQYSLEQIESTFLNPPSAVNPIDTRILALGVSDVLYFFNKLS